jgi:hypothetical protein
MHWLRGSLSRWRRRADRGRPDLALRRLAIESLEDRRLLATLDLDVQLYGDDGGSRGAPIAYARVGETVFLSVTTEDQRLSGTSAGVIALPLDLQWRNDIIRYPLLSAAPPTAPSAIPLPPPTVPNAVVTPSFPLQRSVNQFNVDDVLDPQVKEILGLRGASLPAAGLGQAIGKGSPDPLDPAKNEFSLIHFEAVGAGLRMPFQMTLAGSMSFADGARLDGIADASQDDPLTVTRYLRVQAVVEGRKFEDRNGNGELDEGEPGLPGWQIAAYLDQNGDGLLQQSEFLAGPVPQDGSPDGTVTTGADGSYQLYLDTAEPRLEGSCPAGAPQAYIIVEVLNAGWTQSFPRTLPNSVLDPGLNTGSVSLGEYGYAVTIQPCDPNSGLDDLDFGNFRHAAKSGVKFEDTNGNGAKDAGEPGLSGWTIQLTGTDGLGTPVNLSTTTDVDGAYLFSVPPGTYTVNEVPQSGWTQSYPASGSYTVTLQSGQADSDNDFGNFRPATKSGVKFEDANGNGAKDAGEPGKAVWPIRLTGADGLGNPVNVETTTDSEGRYSFSVPPGTYTVYETLPGANWHQSFPQAGAGIVTAPNGTLGYQVALVSGQLDLDNDFGNYCDVTNGGLKFEDLNGNGVRDPEEPGLPGWTIRLTGTDGGGNAVEMTATTGSDGSYSFSVPPGTYTVYETLPDATWKQSFPRPGTGIVTAPNGTRAYQVTVVSCSIDSDNDFGNLREAAVSGRKFADLNGNGVRDAGEAGLVDWAIRLNGTDALGNPVNQTDQTDDQGLYSFLVPPGVYTVCETLQNGWVQTAPATGCYAVTLTSGQLDGDNDFGNRLANGSLSGFVYADVDADGRRDVDAHGAPIELGLPQVEIALWRNGQLVQTDQTGPDGWYHFEDLEPGTYDVVQVAQPACFLDGTETVGIVLPGRESRGTAGADRITGIAIGGGEHGIDYNFGELGLTAACVNKRMLFGSAEPRRATVYEPLDVSSAVVRGTSGADQIQVQVVGGGVQVTVNGGPTQSFPTADASILTIDAGSGQDTVTYLGSAASEVLRSQPTYAVVRDQVAGPLPAGGVAVDWTYAVEVVHAEQIEATGGSGDARAVLQDSPGNDQLTAAGDSATLTMATDEDLDLLARAVAFERVRAIAAAGGTDEANQTPPLGYELDLVGDWLD